MSTITDHSPYSSINAKIAKQAHDARRGRGIIVDGILPEHRVQPQNSDPGPEQRGGDEGI